MFPKIHPIFHTVKYVWIPIWFLCRAKTGPHFITITVSNRVFYNKTELYLFSPHLHQQSFGRSI